jgi:hypothetical protein
MWPASETEFAYFGFKTKIGAAQHFLNNAISPHHYALNILQHSVAYFCFIFK